MVNLFKYLIEILKDEMAACARLDFSEKGKIQRYAHARTIHRVAQIMRHIQNYYPEFKDHKIESLDDLINAEADIIKEFDNELYKHKQEDDTIENYS